MVTRSHAQLKDDEITEDLSVRHSCETNLKNFSKKNWKNWKNCSRNLYNCGKKDGSHDEPYLDTVIKFQCILCYNKGVKQSESLLNYFLDIFWEKQGVLSIIDTF